MQVPSISYVRRLPLAKANCKSFGRSFSFRQIALQKCGVQWLIAPFAAAVLQFNLDY